MHILQADPLQSDTEMTAFDLFKLVYTQSIDHQYKIEEQKARSVYASHHAQGPFDLQMAGAIKSLQQWKTQQFADKNIQQVYQKNKKQLML